MVKERDNTIDIAKGLCMLLVIGIHTEAYVYVGMPFTFVAVPMFFYMSGFFDNGGGKFYDILIKNIRTLLWPAFIFVLLGTMFHICMDYFKSHTFEMASFDIYRPTANNGPAWFLIALFYTKTLIILFTKKISNQIIIFLISVLLGYIGSTYQLPFLIDEGLAALPFYYTGKITFPYYKMIVNNNILFLCGTIFIALFTAHVCTFTILPIDSGLYSPYYILALIGVLLSFVPIFRFSNVLHLKSLSSFGRHTIGILLVQMPLCVIIPRIAWRLFDKGSILWFIFSFVGYIITVIISYYITLIIEKYSPILFGKTKK